jgi:catechol 2,3-dioxygenase-like lactoylglutathione lyase family enzyme
VLRNSPFFASVAVDDLTAAKDFYGSTLGLDVIDVGDGGLLALRARNGYTVLIYPKDRHEAAGHTVVNFPVDDIEASVDELVAAGVTFERYDEGPVRTNERGIATIASAGPKQAWFRDPAGNILSVIEG